ncbi:hypothetical protein ACE939_06860 [Aquimarina sp. W85]|uniref:hypothetical protein n=1 Tax=Aquimarina rhodophyticola TaxID=3342246 RepID=UPI00367012D5
MPPIKTYLRDELSQGNYTAINNSNRLMGIYASANTAESLLFTSVMDMQLLELTTLSPAWITKGVTLQNFVYALSPTGTSPTYAYIKKRYPILNLINPGDILRNKIIRTRYSIKLLKERNAIGDYLNPLNPIPEGERILLVLTSLEKVIKITIKNETF